MFFVDFGLFNEDVYKAFAKSYIVASSKVLVGSGAIFLETCIKCSGVIALVAP